MARQPGQVFLFDDAELALIKNVFGDNEELIYAIRNVLLQFPLSETQRKLVKDWMSEPVWKVVKKRIFPDLDPECPLTQLGDLYQTLNKDLQTKGVDDMAALFEAKELEIAYFEQQFRSLKDIENINEPLKLSFMAILKDKTPFQKYVDTTARNFIIGYVDGMLTHLKNIAGEKTETVEETKKRLKRDSSK